MIKSNSEQGVGLIEVLIALTVLMAAAGAIVNMQSNSLASANASGIYFSIDRLSNEMIETLRANSVDAAAGLLNIDTQATAVATNNSDVTKWGNSLAARLPSGQGSVACAVEFCDVSISWEETIDGVSRRQFYNTRTRL